jgi:hypothetical protein
MFNGKEKDDKYVFIKKYKIEGNYTQTFDQSIVTTPHDL